MVLFSHSYQTKAIYGCRKGATTETRVCTERWLSIPCQKKNQPDSFSIKHGRNSQLPRLVAAYTSHSTQHLFQVRDKNLENTWARTLPQSHLPPATLLSCLSIFNSAQDTAFLLYIKDLKPCIWYTSGLLLWQAGDASRQQVQGWRVSLPLPQGQTTHWFSCKLTPQQQWPGDHPVNFKPSRKDKVGCVG